MNQAALAVLLVSSDDDDRLRWRRLLARAASPGYAVTEADSGDAALAAVRAAHPDCVLLDRRPLDEAALALLADLRASGAAPVILLVDADGERGVPAALDQGAEDYLITDALTPLRLDLTIRRAVALARLARERDEARVARRATHSADSGGASPEIVAQRLSLAVAAARLNVWDWDVPGGTITFTPDERQLPTELRDRQTYPLEALRATIHPADLPSYERAVFAALEHDRPYRLAVRVRELDGQIRWLEVFGQTQRDAAGQPTRVVGVSRDITDERRLAMTRAQFAAIFTSTPNGLAYLDAELRYTLVNPTFAALHGQTPEALTDRLLRDATPGLAPQLEPLARRALASEGPLHEVEFQYGRDQSSGDLRRWLMRAYPVRGLDHEIVGVGLALVDVTERARTEAALRASEERFRLLAEHAQDAIYRFRTGDAFQFEYLSPAIEQMTGYPRSAFYENPNLVYELVNPEDLAALRRRFPGADVIPTWFTLRWRHRDGHTGWAELHSWVVGGETPGSLVVEGVARDITARRQAEAAREAAYRQLETVLQTLNEGVMAITPDTALVLINPAAQRQLGLDPAALPRTLAELYDATQAAVYDQAGDLVPRDQIPAMRALRGERFQHVELRMRVAGAAEDRWGVFSGAPVYGADGDVVLAVITGADSTQRNRDAAELAARAEMLSRTNADLSRALKLKDEFLAMMSHELRTPLNVILGVTEGMEEGDFGPLDARQLEALGKVRHSGRHLLALLSDILDLAQLEAGAAALEWVPVDIDQLCRAALQFVQAAAQRKQIHLRYAIEAGIMGLRADERRLIQVLVNLLDNAVKFTPEGGSVGLDVAVDEDQERLQLTVWDTGIGIAAADFGRLFQPFTQVDGRLSRQYGGIGLGLTLVRRLVDLHGGSVTLESAPGQGSRFTVSLPWRSSDNVAASAGQAPTAQPGAWPRPPRVVVADDHELTLAVYRDMLSSHGCHVTVARTGAEALAQIRADRPDVAVLDIQMPELDGLTVIRQLRADPAFADLPIIALTALAMPGDRERCMAAGANLYLAKPVSIRALLAAIAALLARHSGGAQ